MHEPLQRLGPMDTLSARVDPVHLRQRLGIESEGEAPVFGRGRTYFHPENALSLSRLLRLALRLSGLYRRGQRNARDIALVHHRLPIRNLPAPLVGLRLLQLSDLHIDAHPEFARVLAERVGGIDYDVCVLTGDYRYRTYGPLQPALEGLDYLRRHLRDPVYAVLGNHDSIHMVPAMEAMGIRLLLNEWARLERGGKSLCLVGVDDPHFFRTDNLERACDGVPHQAPSILLCHSPELFRQAAHSGFDAVLCGHTHGGQIRLPGGIALLTNAECPRSFTAGAWRYRTLYGYTSVGAGSSIVDVRFNCRPEVVLHHLCRWGQV
ncbi:MAG: metallophosphoesterase [Nitrococcus sp.]|nr:metallophosphoesterase [Nitrococcus sp.]